MRRVLLGLSSVLALVVLSAGVCWAGPVSLSPVAQGNWGSGGGHSSSQSNYYVQNNVGFSSDNNFFVFDMASVIGTITGAQLTLSTCCALPGGDTPGTYQLFDVSTPISSLEMNDAGDPSGQAIFTDLGTGVSYGSITYDPSSLGALITITFNANGIAALNSAEGGMFAVGGTVFNSGNTLTALFGISGINSGNQLLLTTSPTPTPEPSSLLLLGTGLLGLGPFIRRRFAKS